MSDKPEISVRDALVGEILGELVLVRQGIAEFQAALPGQREQIREAGELASLRFAEKGQHVAAELDERITTLNAAAQDFRAVRELLMGELGVKTAQQFEGVLAGVSRRMASNRRIELVVTALGSSLLTAALVVLALRHF
ncbi:hypothetical protein [Paraburkholderia largidicola]|uniref:Uncharacterized protein n=1 Tax=Paraburkholderia largidicola TaxID=3014751 RepID=A0A7I8C310_9BURK|nr:hypothetical protein [Paraburkholderia sp. PGU16]BCF95424.1 hypothetical protein PPGU16_84910 [Paraburkholderia sp. PGU16]